MSEDARRAVFLDRDGTIIIDRHYLHDPAGVELMPGAGVAIARLNRAGIPVVLITNQSGIGRGYFTEEGFDRVQQRMLELLGDYGARLDGVYHCPHAPDEGCDCRKPQVGMFRQAAEELDLELRGSFFIGDRMRDIEPARELGGIGIRVESGGAEASDEPDPDGMVGDGAIFATVSSLDDAVDRILGFDGVD